MCSLQVLTGPGPDSFLFLMRNFSRSYRGYCKSTSLILYEQPSSPGTYHNLGDAQFLR